ncbi:MAG: alpha/beta hydrolase [Flavobacteriales bacterium]
MSPDLHYTLTGKGKTVVFIHGAYINSSMWQHQIGAFAEQFQVLTIDLPGHGKSAGVEVTEYSVESYADIVLNLLDDLSIKTASFAGLSLGAMIAQNIAARFPNRVDSLILVGSPASMKLTPAEWFMTTFLFPKWFAMWLFGNLSLNQFMKLSFFMTWFMRGNKWLGERETRAAIREAISDVKQSELRKIYPAVHSFRKQNLYTGDYPALMINGEYDSPVLHFHSQYLNRKLGTRGTLHHIAKAGHACNFDEPDAFNSFVIHWMNTNLSDRKLSSDQSIFESANEK